MTTIASDSIAPRVEDVVLRDGSTLRLRVPTAADESTLIGFFRDLSPDSRYLRFHGATSIDHGTVSGALETDWRTRASLLGELAGPGGTVRPVALATYVRLHDPSRAEVALRLPTICTDAASGLGCSSGSPPMRPRPASRSSWQRSCRRTMRCSASSTMRASRLHGRFRVVSSRCRFGSPRGSTGGGTPRPSATTSPSPRLCARSSNLGRSP